MFMTVELQGDQLLRRKLLRGAEAAENMKPALWEVREDLFRIIRTNFESQGRRGGGSWKQLDPKTAAAKERRGQDPRILFGTHKLFNSLTRRGDRNMRSAVTKDRFYLRSTLPYVETHEYGDEERGIPARPFLHVLPSDRVRWVKTCERYLMEAMNV